MCYSTRTVSLQRLSSELPSDKKHQFMSACMANTSCVAKMSDQVDLTEEDILGTALAEPLGSTQFLH